MISNEYILNLVNEAKDAQMTVVKKIPQKLCHNAGMIRNFFNYHKKIKIISVLLIFLLALLLSYSHAYLQLMPERQQVTDAIRKDNNPVNVWAKDQCFLSLSNRDQEILINHMRNKLIPYELRQQFGSNIIVDKLLYLEKNSLMFSYLESVFFVTRKKAKLTRQLGLAFLC